MGGGPPRWERALALILALAACGKDSTTGDDTGPDHRTFDECDGDPASFVRQAFLSLDGRRPKSQAEVDVYVDLYTQAAARGDDPVDVTTRAIMSRPEFAERWLDALMDALRVQRMDVQTEADCWDQNTRNTVSPALAQGVRDKPATQTADGTTFTMLDLAQSALALDDLSPLYRGQLFSLVAHPIPAANVGAVEAELARRADFGGTFDAAFLHRDVVCLGCHNSEQSVTDSDDPALDRHWPVPGLAEKAVFGVSTGVAAERAHAAFRVDGFVGEGTVRAWGMSSRCGAFASPSAVPTDIADVDAKLGAITGKRATVFDVEASLARGFATLRTGVPTGAIASRDSLPASSAAEGRRGPSASRDSLPASSAAEGRRGPSDDPDVALAWLVTLKMTEDIYKQVTGTQLTIANYFPRNQASSDLLYVLASKLATSGYSLKTLLVAIVASDYFNRIAPDGQCGESPYTYPAVFDPWVIADADEARRKNGPGDAVTAVDARTLLAATSAALEWPPPPAASRFPDYGEPGCESESCNSLQQDCNFGECCNTYQAACVMNGVLPQTEVPFLRSIGLFLRNSEAGFRGLNFQSRLAWEDRNGTCAKPHWVSQDFVDQLAMAGAASPDAKARDLVAALKDRLVGEPAIAEGAETDALIAIMGALDGPASAVSADALRKVCGALLDSPQFLLQGVAGRGSDQPLLTPANAGYDAVCADLAATGIGVPGRIVTCANGALALAEGRTLPKAAPPAGVRELPRAPRGKPDPRRTPAPLTAPRM